MPAERSRDATNEKPVEVINGWAMLFISFALMIGAVVFVFVGPGFPPFRLLGAVLFEVFMIVMLTGLFSLQPNEARVLILFGHYKGTVRKSGFHWANPFYARNRGKIPWGVAPPPDPKSGTRIGPGASGIIYKPLKATISLREKFRSGTTIVSPGFTFRSGANARISPVGVISRISSFSCANRVGPPAFAT